MTQHCVKLDIPLKRLADFWADAKDQINDMKLLVYGEKQVIENERKTGPFERIQNNMEQAKAAVAIRSYAIVLLLVLVEFSF